MKNKKGFTLIELLIAISIIGILATIVLSATSDSRGSASDTNIKKLLGSIRATPEIFYASAGTFNGMCDTTTGGGRVGSVVLQAHKQYNSSATAINTTISTAYARGTTSAAATCHTSTTSWAIVVALKNPRLTNGGWCIDSTGKSKEVSALVANALTC